MSKKKEGQFVFRTCTEGHIHAMRAMPDGAATELIAGIYEVRQIKPATALVLVPSSKDFAVKKVYGNAHTDVDRYFRSYERNNRNLGVLLAGDKGSGKTTTANLMVEKALQMSMPVLRINECFDPALLRDLFVSIEQDVLVLFDEYDKTHSDSDSNVTAQIQNGMLSVIEGAGCGTGKKMIVLVVNDPDTLSCYLSQRPGRVRYTKYFDNLPLDVLLQYARENVKDITDEKLFELVKIRSLASIFNFDMMAALIDETNCFGGSYLENMGLMFGTGRHSRMRFHTAMLAAITMSDGTVVDRHANEQVGRTGLEIEIEMSTFDDASGTGPVVSNVMLNMGHFVSASEDYTFFDYEKDGVKYRLYYVDRTADQTHSNIHKGLSDDRTADAGLVDRANKAYSALHQSNQRRNNGLLPAPVSFYRGMVGPASSQSYDDSFDPDN